MPLRRSLADIEEEEILEPSLRRKPRRPVRSSLAGVTDSGIAPLPENVRATLASTEAIREATEEPTAVLGTNVPEFVPAPAEEVPAPPVAQDVLSIDPSIIEESVRQQETDDYRKAVGEPSISGRPEKAGFLEVNRLRDRVAHRDDIANANARVGFGLTAERREFADEDESIASYSDGVKDISDNDLSLMVYGSPVSEAEGFDREMALRIQRKRDIGLLEDAQDAEERMGDTTFGGKTAGFLHDVKDMAGYMAEMYFLGPGAGLDEALTRRLERKGGEGMIDEDGRFILTKEQQGELESSVMGALDGAITYAVERYLGKGLKVVGKTKAGQFIGQKINKGKLVKYAKSLADSISKKVPKNEAVKRASELAGFGNLFEEIVVEEYSQAIYDGIDRANELDENGEKKGVLSGITESLVGTIKATPKMIATFSVFGGARGGASKYINAQETRRQIRESFEVDPEAADAELLSIPEYNERTPIELEDGSIVEGVSVVESIEQETDPDKKQRMKENALLNKAIMDAVEHEQERAERIDTLRNNPERAALIEDASGGDVEVSTDPFAGPEVNEDILAEPPSPKVITDKPILDVEEEGRAPAISAGEEGIDQTTEQVLDDLAKQSELGRQVQDVFTRLQNEEITQEQAVVEYNELRLAQQAEEPTVDTGEEDEQRIRETGRPEVLDRPTGRAEAVPRPVRQEVVVSQSAEELRQNVPQSEEESLRQEELNKRTPDNYEVEYRDEKAFVTDKKTGKQKAVYRDELRVIETAKKSQDNVVNTLTAVVRATPEQFRPDMGFDLPETLGEFNALTQEQQDAVLLKYLPRGFIQGDDIVFTEDGWVDPEQWTHELHHWGYDDLSLNQKQLLEKRFTDEKGRFDEEEMVRYLLDNPEMVTDGPLSQSEKAMNILRGDPDFRAEFEEPVGESSAEVDGERFVVTQEQDAEYLQAVEQGDTEKAQEMVDRAASDAGYDSPQVYHGGVGASSIKEFSESYSGDTTGNNQAGAFHFVDAEGVAEDYGRQSFIRRYQDDPEALIHDGFVPEGTDFNEMDDVYGFVEELAEDNIEKISTRLKMENPIIIDNKMERVNVQEIEELSMFIKYGEDPDYKYTPEYMDQIYKGYDQDDIEAFREEIEERARENELLEPDDEIEAYVFEQATDEIMTENGYEREETPVDGIIIKDMIDDIGDRSNMIADQYIVFSPEQVKSSAPVTRDDQGVIPLSQRFDPEREDIRFTAGPSDDPALDAFRATWTPIKRPKPSDPLYTEIVGRRGLEGAVPGQMFAPADDRTAHNYDEVADAARRELPHLVDDTMSDEEVLRIVLRGRIPTAKAEARRAERIARETVDAEVYENMVRVINEGEMPPPEIIELFPREFERALQDTGKDLVRSVRDEVALAKAAEEFQRRDDKRTPEEVFRDEAKRYLNSKTAQKKSAVRVEGAIDKLVGQLDENNQDEYESLFEGRVARTPFDRGGFLEEEAVTEGEGLTDEGRSEIIDRMAVHILEQTPPEGRGKRVPWNDVEEDLRTMLSADPDVAQEFDSLWNKAWVKVYDEMEAQRGPEMKERIKTLKEDMKARVRSIDQAVTDFDEIEKSLPVDIRGRLRGVRRIPKLAKPETKERYLTERMHRAEKLLDDAEKGINVKKLSAVVKKPLKDKKAKLSQSARRELSTVDKILKMTPDEYNAKMEELTNKDTMTEKDVEEYVHLSTFGNLRQQPVEVSRRALEEMDRLVRGEKARYKVLDEDFRKEVNPVSLQAQKGVSDDQTGIIPPTEELQRLKADPKYKARIVWRTALNLDDTLETSLDKLFRGDKKTEMFENPVAQYIQNLVIDADTKEAKAIIDYEKRILDAFAESFGVKADTLDARKKQRENSKIQTKDTGVFRYMSPAIQERIEELQARLNSNELTDKERRRLDFQLSQEQEKLEYVEGVPETEMPLSQNQAYHLWMGWQSLDSREKMKKWGYTEQTMQQIEEFMTVGTKKWAEWQMENVYNNPANFKALNDVFFETFYTSLVPEENYSPRYYKYTRSAEELRQSVDMSEARGASGSYMSGRLISRIEHGREPELVDGDKVLADYLQETEHFKAWAPSIKRVRAVLNNTETQELIKIYHGAKSANNLNGIINDLASGHPLKSENIRLLNWIRGNFATSKVGLPGVSPAIKQLVSIPAYPIQIGYVPWMKHTSELMRNPARAKKLAGELWNHPLMIARGKRGYEQNIDLALHPTVLFMRTNFQKVKSGAMILTRLGDKAAIMAGALGTYDYLQQEARAGNKGEEAQADPKTWALRETMKITHRAQQSARLQDFATRQKMGSLMNLFTTFTTSPAQYQRIVNASFRNIIEGRGNKKTNIRKLIGFQFILPMLFQMTTNLITSGNPWRHKDDEDDIVPGLPNHILRSLILGNANSWVLAGDLIEGLVDGITTGNAWMNGLSTPITGLSERMARFGVNIHKRVQDGEWPKNENFARLAGEASDLISGLGVERTRKIVKKHTPEAKKERREDDIVEDSVSRVSPKSSGSRVSRVMQSNYRKLKANGSIPRKDSKGKMLSESQRKSRANSKFYKEYEDKHGKKALDKMKAKVKEAE